MGFKQVFQCAVVCTLLSLTIPWEAHAQSAQASAPKRIFNTVKQKLMEGKQVIGGTVSSPDPDIYCAMANAGFDFLWIEMQHSPLNYQEVARMIRACKGAPAIPFIRVPDATEGDIQKATDIGALGIIVPMVDSVAKIEAAVTFAKYPPIGKRSQGGGQYSQLWGNDYRQTANDNIMVVAMIESPAGVEIADKMAAVPGVDIVFAASTDLASFSGLRQGDPKYEALVTRIHDATLKADRKLGGPVAWKDRKERPDFTFFQGPGESSLIRSGAQAVLGTPSDRSRPGLAPTEGKEPSAATTEDEIRQAEKDWAAGITSRDYAVLDTMLADQLIYAHSKGVVETKSEYMDRLRRGAQKYDRIEHQSITIKSHGDTAVAHSQVRMTGTSDIRPFDDRLMMMHLWVKRDGRWQLAAHQTTRLQ